MATFVAPEGVYSLTSEHLPQSSGVSTPYPTRVSAALVSPDSDDNEPPSPSVPEQHSIFSPRPGKKSSARPKHNLRTSSSSFVTRIQSTDGWPKLLQSKHGAAAVVAYNVAKSLVLVDGASRAKVWPVPFHTCALNNGPSRSPSPACRFLHVLPATTSTIRQHRPTISTSSSASAQAISSGLVCLVSRLSRPTNSLSLRPHILPLCSPQQTGLYIQLSLHRCPLGPCLPLSLPCLPCRRHHPPVRQRT